MLVDMGVMLTQTCFTLPLRTSHCLPAASCRIFHPSRNIVAHGYLFVCFGPLAPQQLKRRNSYLSRTGAEKDRLLACTKGPGFKMPKSGSGKAQGRGKSFVFSVQDESSMSMSMDLQRQNSGSNSQPGGMATSGGDGRKNKRAFGSIGQNKHNASALKRSKSLEKTAGSGTATTGGPNKFSQKSSSLFSAFSKNKPEKIVKSR